MDDAILIRLSGIGSEIRAFGREIKCTRDIYEQRKDALSELEKHIREADGVDKETRDYFLTKIRILRRQLEEAYQRKLYGDAFNAVMQLDHKKALDKLGEAWKVRNSDSEYGSATLSNFVRYHLGRPDVQRDLESRILKIDDTKLIEDSRIISQYPAELREEVKNLYKTCFRERILRLCALKKAYSDLGFYEALEDVEENLKRLELAYFEIFGEIVSNFANLHYGVEILPETKDERE
ncbi:hypothetical protein DRJ16_01385 [Candidatus Woesearchaeota archaeon]|nr:MAG: hypothetical protein DRJ16_01385 [Candidatus Woesearchaeota archaeon]